jgi:hypothetical protein
MMLLELLQGVGKNAMTSLTPGRLPKLAVTDFGPGQDHLVEVFLQGKVVALLHKDDPARQVLPGLQFPGDDGHTYVFVHGGQEETRFENMAIGTHEIPEHVVADLLVRQYGSQLNGMSMRLCTCYGNMLRPGDARTIAASLASLLPTTVLEGYHGLVILDKNPPALRLGRSVRWDASGPVVVGPPGPWEPITP